MKNELTIEQMEINLDKFIEDEGLMTLPPPVAAPAAQVAAPPPPASVVLCEPVDSYERQVFDAALAAYSRARSVGSPEQAKARFIQQWYQNGLGAKLVNDAIAAEVAAGDRDKRERDAAIAYSRKHPSYQSF